MMIEKEKEIPYQLTRKGVTVNEVGGEAQLSTKFPDFIFVKRLQGLNYLSLQENIVEQF